MRLALLILAAATTASGADPFDKAFDPFSTARSGERKQAFDAALKARGVAAAVRRFRKFEKEAAELQKRIDEVYADYVKASDAYWGYRRKTGAVAGAVPQKLNKSFLDQELLWKHIANLKRRMRTVHRHAEAKAAAAFRALEGKQGDRVRATLTKGLKDKNHHQRARCRAILEGPPKQPAPDTDGPLDFFGIKTGSKKIVVVFDRPDLTAKRLTAWIDALPTDVEFSLVISGWKPRVWKKRLSRDRAGAKRFIQKATDRRSDIHAALLAALGLGGDTILFLTVAGPWSGGQFGTQVMFPDPLQVTQEILAANRVKGIRIHGIGPSGDRNGNWLQNLCAQFGGTCIAR